MIDLTPLDVRKKKGDFQRVLRGYDPGEVDTFLGFVEARLEALVRENLGLTEKVQQLTSQIEALEGRERAVQDALVTAQKLREDVQHQSKREAESLRDQAAREAESLREQTRREADSLRGEAQREAEAVKDRARREADLLRREIVGDMEARLREAEGLIRERQRALEELERSRRKFLKGFRTLLERELDSVEVEESRRPLEDAPLELDFKGWRRLSDEGLSGQDSSTDPAVDSLDGESPVEYAFEPVIDLAAPAEAHQASTVEGWGSRPGDEPPQGEFSDIVPVGVLEPAPEPVDPGSEEGGDEGAVSSADPSSEEGGDEGAVFSADPGSEEGGDEEVISSADPGPEEVGDEGAVSSAVPWGGEGDLEVEREAERDQDLRPGEGFGDRDQPDPAKMNSGGVDADFASRVKELLDSRSGGKAKPSSEPLWLSSLLEKDGKTEKARGGRGEAGPGKGRREEASGEGTGGDDK